MVFNRLKKLSIFALGVFYILAGLNHFVSPGFYLPLIPPAFLYPELINIGSGVAEIILGAGVFFARYRSRASWGIILLLLLFIPSHVYFIQMGSCIEGSLCTRPAVGWIRLIVIHPILVLWAYYSGLRTVKTT